LRQAIVKGLLGVLILGLATFGWFRYVSRDSRQFDEADVAVRVSGKPAECEVSRRQEKVRALVRCDGLAKYFQNELRLSQGVKYYFVDGGNSHREEIEALGSTMAASGYPAVGIMAVFISEPAPSKEH
jgi:hypothetical protein